MLVLALDTSGAVVTVALHDGASVVARRSTLDARRHAELLAPSIAAVLQEGGATRADVTTVAVGVGPGPFTGLRAGIVTARVLGGPAKRLVNTARAKGANTRTVRDGVAVRRVGGAGPGDEITG